MMFFDFLKASCDEAVQKFLQTILSNTEIFEKELNGDPEKKENIKKWNAFPVFNFDDQDSFGKQIYSFYEYYQKAMSGQILNKEDLLQGPLFLNGKCIGGGGTTIIFKINLPCDIGYLKKEDFLVLRMVADWRVMASLILSQLNDENITGFFPRIYGVFKYKDPTVVKKGSPIAFSLMEYVETDFSKYFKDGVKIPDSVLFEFAHGVWCGNYYKNITVNDPKFSNYGLKKVDFGRCYHLGDDAYYFPPSYMPVRLDLDCFTYGKVDPFERFIPKDAVETKNGKSFIEELKKGGHSIFSLFRKYFAEYRCLDESTLPENTKHYVISKEVVAKFDQAFQKTT